MTIGYTIGVYVCLQLAGIIYEMKPELQDK